MVFGCVHGKPVQKIFKFADFAVFPSTVKRKTLAVWKLHAEEVLLIPDRCPDCGGSPVQYGSRVPANPAFPDGGYAGAWMVIE